MNKKLLKTLQDKCKDFGLTEKAIEELAQSASEGLTDESSDEDIAKVADSLVPYAKMMQGEITRKTRKQAPKPKTPRKKTTTREDSANTSQPIEGTTCPLCGQGHIIKGKTAYGCSRWKEGCTYRLPFPESKQ